MKILIKLQQEVDRYNVKGVFVGILDRPYWLIEGKTSPNSN